jgi:hypothetical protein
MSAPKDLLGQLHAQVTEQLIAKVMSGDCTAAEMANAIRFLKDNGIEAIPEPGSEMQRLVDAIPDFPDHLEGLPN